MKPIHPSRLSSSLPSKASKCRLALLALLGMSLAAHAGNNTWNYSAGARDWDNATANWFSPTIWTNGDDAFFDPTGSGAVAIVSGVSAKSMTVTATGYSFTGGPLLLTGTAGITQNANFTMGSIIAGSDGLNLVGNSVMTMTARNTYSGTTNIASGSVILNAAGTTSGGSYGSHAIGNDNSATVINVNTGATLKYFNALDGPGTGNLRAPNGQLNNQVTLNLGPGAVFDLAGDDNQNNMPVPEGLGIITNSSPYARAVLKIGIATPTVKTIGGVIQDGGPLATSVVAGKVSYRMDVDFQTGFSNGNTIVLEGANTYLGSTRNSSGTIRFSGVGKWGTPVNTGVADTSSPQNTIICSGGANELRFDFNGTNQITGSIVGTGGGFANNAAGTNSTLIIGGANFSTPYGTIGQSTTGTTTNGNTQNPWPNTGGAPSGTNNGNPTSGKITDNTTGSGGKMALTKVGTGTVTFHTAISDFSGPTTIYAGILRWSTVGAPSPNSSIRIYTPGVLQLDYTGTRNVNGLYINAVKQPTGTYDATTHPGFISGPGQITVSEVHPDEVPTLQIADVGGTDAALTWTGFGILQESADLVTWTDLYDAETPYVTPLGATKNFFRIKY